jgi:hypothetical protein
MNKKMAIVGRFTMAEPSFRTASRIVAFKTNSKEITLALQFQHEGEPGAWITEEWFPWHASNFNSIIRTGARFHHLIERIIEQETK